MAHVLIWKERVHNQLSDGLLTWANTDIEFVSYCFCNKLQDI